MSIIKILIKNQSGIALILVIILLAVIGSLTSALLIMYSSNINLAQNASARSQVFYAAEGGVNYLDLKLNEFYKNSIAGRSFFKADDVKNELENLKTEIEHDNIEIADYKIDIDFIPHSNYKDNSIYIYYVTADNGEESETITVQYEIAHLIDYFKYSRFANKINIENSTFSDVDDHGFGTAEILYSKWSDSSSYYEGEYVIHNNLVYISKGDFSAGEVVEPGEEGWQNNWFFDNSFSQWGSGDVYKSREKVVYNNEIYTSEINDNSSEPGSNSDWELNDPDLAKEGIAKGKVEYNQTALPSSDDYDYQEKIVEEFKKRLVKEGGYVYKDDQGTYSNWSNQSYSVGTKVNYNDKVYKSINRNRYWSWSSWQWIYSPQPEPGTGSNWKDYWTEQNAGQAFIDDNNRYYNKGNYIYIDGDLTPNMSASMDFYKSDEVLHVLVDGEISPNANLSLDGNANIIFYTTSDTVSFENGYISMPWGSNINLAYFAPFATYSSNGFSGGYASSMIFNEINLKNENITSVKTYSDDNPLRGSIDPGIAELTRVHGDLNYDIDKTGPIRLNWSVTN